MQNSDQLRSINNFEYLIHYLEEKLDWPLQEYGFEELTFEYQPAELGLKEEDAAKVKNIHQLRPLQSGQPWGIFFVEFENKKLPVVVLRRILSHLVIKKRASANKAREAAWHAEDLMFITTYGEDGSMQREVAFAHFHQLPGDLPTLRVLGWDGGDTPLKLAHVDHQLRQYLAWPDDPSNINSWREHWSKPFRHRIGHVIRTADSLAEVLAALARGIRDKAMKMISVESSNGPLRQLHKAFQTSLIHDLTEESFADTYAQTITYGLLTAAISRTEGSEGRHGTFIIAENVTDMVPITNPFLREMLQTFLKVGGRKGGIDFDELGIQDVVELLRGEETDLPAILRDFGNKTQGEDPVIHFYEHFLSAYNKKLKIQRGVFYTPQPVVSYIIRSVHELLQNEFGLEDGLASTVTWGEMIAQHPEIKLPVLTPRNPAKHESKDILISPDTPFVMILDIATGTGTFLVEVIDIVNKTMKAKWQKESKRESEITKLWNEYVPQHLLPRLYGYELMMAPYAIAHMKIGLKLFETGYNFESNERVRVYLTNTLEPPSDTQQQLAGILPALAHEAEAVNDVKRYVPFTVVVGNPPYSSTSWNNGIWITNLSEDYKRTVRSEESQIQALSNDYIKFLRFGEWHIEKMNVGILGLITGHGYLHGTQPRDLRNHLSASFDRCYCLDLHGSLRRTGTNDAEDEPIFEIMTGVAILLAFRAWIHQKRALTMLESLTGRVEKKFSYLRSETALKSLSSEILHQPISPYFYFTASASGQDIQEEYYRYYDLPIVYGTGNRQTDKEKLWATGFTSQQDELAIAFSRDELTDKMRALAESLSFDDLRKKYRLCTTDQWYYPEAKKFAKNGLWQQHVQQVLYRPFDMRWTVLHKHVLTILRNQVMSQFDGTPNHNLGLISSRAVNDFMFAHCFVTCARVDRTSISSKTSTNAYIFPLYFTDDDLLGKKTHHNFNPDFLAKVFFLLGLSYDKKNDDLDGSTLESIFNYIYAVLHSPIYRTRYAEFLKIDFPRVPLTSSLELFRSLAKLGGELVAMHLLESSKVNDFITRFTGNGDNTIPKKPIWKDNAVWINPTQRFEGVPENIWNFHIGGYQVCEKWLKDRKGRTLYDEDIKHYQRIVVALNETIRIMAEIDRVIDEHGGWPGAFYAGKSTTVDDDAPT